MQRACCRGRAGSSEAAYRQIDRQKDRQTERALTTILALCKALCSSAVKTSSSTWNGDVIFAAPSSTMASPPPLSCSRGARRTSRLVVEITGDGWPLR
eukprot:308502-Rhodomonas_salina.2